MRQLSYPENKADIANLLADRRFDFQDERITVVSKILTEVTNRGDQALREYTERYDGIKLVDFKVTPEEIERAYQEIEQGFIDSIQKAIKNIDSFHRRQLRQSWFAYQNDNMTGQLINPLERVGAYVPGGRAAYPSSVLMTVRPAKIAGVSEVVMVSPPKIDGSLNPYTLVAASEAGVDQIYKLGGAQAVAALAFGTETIKPVDKIVGPGNIYVTLAKKLVYGVVDIDMLAGPSEVLILADDSANPAYIAADLLSQAEHDPQAVSVLITNSPELAKRTSQEVKQQLSCLKRKEIASRAIEDNGLIIIVDELDRGIELTNRFAPEHFELVTREPFKYLSLIKNAGAVFIGEYSSEPLGDYLAGPNHVLPTGGTARFASPLNIDDFIKKSSLIFYQKTGLDEIAPDIIKLAQLEGLDAHARAIAVRTDKEGIING